jgi:Protein of unknown function (DUF2612)
MQDYRQTIISQYAQSPTLNQIITNLNNNIDPSAIIDDFYNMVWNVDTAQGYGLDVWGRIVGVGRVLQISASKYFGFDEATTLSADPFEQSPFYGGQTINNNFILSDPGFRTLIYAKALANITDGSIRTLNQILTILFGGVGNAYVQDNRNMTLTYTFTFTPTPVDVAIIQQSGVLPRPTGVQALYLAVPSQFEAAALGGSGSMTAAATQIGP